MPVKPLDHDTATDKQKRSHYGSGCRDQACRDAVAAYAREATARRKATALAMAGVHKPSGGEESVEPPVSTPTPGTVSTASAPVPASPSETPAVMAVDPPERVVPRPLPAPTSVEGRTTARGASRRLQGLVWLGYTPVDLALATQISVDNIWWLLFAPPKTVKDVTHRIIATHYNRLKIQSPEHPDLEVARNKVLAVDHGWAGPFDWDDIDTDAKPPHGNHRSSRAETLQARVDELEEELAKKLDYSAPPAPVDFDLRAELTQVQRELTGALQKATDRQAALELEQSAHAATKMNLAQAESELLHAAATVTPHVEPADDAGLVLSTSVLGQQVEIPIVLRVSVALGE